MSSLADAALGILRQGFPVFPVDQATKRPLVKWQPYQKQVPTEEQINDWWTRWPDANIGMATGRISCLVVVDCDSEEATRRFVDTYPEVQDTSQAETGRGRHFFFQWEAGIRYDARKIFGKEIDVRGEGGFVILPPSLHANGKLYRWLNESDPQPLSQGLREVLIRLESDRDPVIVPLESVERTKVTWVLPGRIPRKKLTLILGDPGDGKTFLVNAIIARLTRGEPILGDVQGEHTKPGNILILTAEDDLDDTVRPRLEDMGADLSRVKILAGLKDNKGTLRGITLQDIAPLDKAMDEVKPDLVMIDPLIAYVAGKDTNKASEVRALLVPLIELARKHNCAIVCIMHLNKGEAQKAIYKGQGSMDFIGAARSVFFVGRNPLDREERIMCHIKCNNAPLASSWSFRIEGTDNGEAHFIWGTESPLTAEEILGTGGSNIEGKINKLEVAKALLVGALSRGSYAATKLEELSGQLDISLETLRRAKKELSVNSDKSGFQGGWSWSLPGAETDPDQNLDHLGAFVSSLMEKRDDKVLKKLENIESELDHLRVDHLRKNLLEGSQDRGLMEGHKDSLLNPNGQPWYYHFYKKPAPDVVWMRAVE